MVGTTMQEEAKRWTKFPATLLFITCLLWLVAILPRLATDWDGFVAQPAESALGAVVVFLQLIVLPIAGPLCAIGMLFLQRSALYLGAALPLIPMLTLTIEKAQRIGHKFSEYRSAGSVSSFGDGVLDGIIVGGLWVIVFVHWLYIRRALIELSKAEQWQSVRQHPGQVSLAQPAGQQPSVAAATEQAADETCFLLPDTPGRDDDD